LNDFKFLLSSESQEARAQIQLPPGAVVSRLTLWVNGEEREAAFAGKAEVRAAYQKIAVVRRQDPVLVTSSGRDRVLVQCFPVPRNGGTIKIRFGITAPFTPVNETLGHLLLPQIIERNFHATKEFRHNLWLESPESITTGASLQNSTEQGIHRLSGRVVDSMLNQGRPAVFVQRYEKWRASHFRLEDGNVVRQRLVAGNQSNPVKQMIFVMDGSVDMKKFAKPFASVLEKLPETIRVGLVMSGADGTISELAPSPLNDSSRQKFREKMDRFSFKGGVDNVLGLERALEMVGSEGAIVWVHGPQPVMLSPGAFLIQQHERQPSGAPVYDLQVLSRPNLLAQQLEPFRRYVSVPVVGAFEEDLLSLCQKLVGTRPWWKFVRDLIPQPEMVEGPFTKSKHLARLWAFQTVLDAVEINNIKGAVQLAQKFQLVTPVSGAVVLETLEQFKESGLTPVELTSVPNIPEPSTFILMALALMA